MRSRFSQNAHYHAFEHLLEIWPTLLDKLREYGPQRANAIGKIVRVFLVM